MSGGYFDDADGVARFADDLLRAIDKDGPSVVFERSDLKLLYRCHEVISMAGALAHELDLLFEGDHGIEIFRSIADEILDGEND